MLPKPKMHGKFGQKQAKNNKTEKLKKRERKKTAYKISQRICTNTEMQI